MKSCLYSCGYPKFGVRISPTSRSRTPVRLRSCSPARPLPIPRGEANPHRLACRSRSPASTRSHSPKSLRLRSPESASAAPTPRCRSPLNNISFLGEGRGRRSNWDPRRSRFSEVAGARLVATAGWHQSLSHCPFQIRGSGIRQRRGNGNARPRARGNGNAFERCSRGNGNGFSLPIDRKSSSWCRVEGGSYGHGSTPRTWRFSEIVPPSHQIDLFVESLVSAPLRDDRATMEFPFFALPEKRPLLTPLVYQDGDVSVRHLAG